MEKKQNASHEESRLRSFLTGDRFKAALPLIGFVIIIPKNQLSRMKAVCRNIHQPWYQIGVIRVKKPNMPQVYYSK